nr:hypothetical protein BgiMline_030455 [Biomphalaria glabrata]
MMARRCLKLVLDGEDAHEAAHERSEWKDDLTQAHIGCIVSGHRVILVRASDRLESLDHPESALFINVRIKRFPTVKALGVW